MIWVARALLLRQLGERLRLVEITEPRYAMRERADDLVVLRFEIIRAAEVTFGADRIVERDVHEMAEVVMVPGRLRCERRRLSIRTNGNPVVAEERVAQTHQGMKDVVLGAVA